MKNISKHEILAFVSAAADIGYVILDNMILINRRVLGSAAATGEDLLLGKFSDGNNIFYWSMGDNFEQISNGIIFQPWICEILDRWLDARPKFDPDEASDLNIRIGAYRGGPGRVAGDFDFMLIDYSDYHDISDFIQAGENQVAILLPDNPGLVVESIALYLTSARGYELS